MALLIEGMECPLCGNPMYLTQRLTAFRPFTADQDDPLWKFSDGVFHTRCFQQDPLAQQVLARAKEAEKRSDNWPPLCSLCKAVITQPDDYFMFGFLTSDASSQVYLYNHVQVHRSCLLQWAGLSGLIQRLEDLHSHSDETKININKVLTLLKNSVASQ